MNNRKLKLFLVYVLTGNLLFSNLCACQTGCLIEDGVKEGSIKWDGSTCVECSGSGTWVSVGGGCDAEQTDDDEDIDPGCGGDSGCCQDSVTSPSPVVTGSGTTGPQSNTASDWAPGYRPLIGQDPTAPGFHKPQKPKLPHKPKFNISNLVSPSLTGHSTVMQKIVRNTTLEAISVIYNTNIFKVDGLNSSGMLSSGAEATVSLACSSSVARSYQQGKASVIFGHGVKVDIASLTNKNAGLPAGVSVDPIGCKSCGGGVNLSPLKSPISVKFGNMSIVISNREIKTLGGEATWTGYTSFKVLIDGKYIIPYNIPGYDVGPTTSWTQNNKSYIGVKVTRPYGDVYYFGKQGTYLYAGAVLKLQKIVCKVNDGGDTENILYSYNTTSGLLERIEDESSNEIIYNYAYNPIEKRYKLSGISFTKSGDQNPCRNYALAYDKHGHITQFNCSTCGSSGQDYSYIDTDNVNKKLLTSALGIGGVDTSYSYDDKNNIKYQKIGPASDNILMKSWDYIYEFSNGNYYQIYKESQKDYVDSVNYRLTETFYDENGTLDSIRQYMKLQPVMVGEDNPYIKKEFSIEEIVSDSISETCDVVQEFYSDDGEESSEVSGLKSVKVRSNDNGEVYKQYIEATDGTKLVKYEKTYFDPLTDGIDDFVIGSLTNNRLGVTNYYYVDKNLVCTKYPSPGTGNAFVGENDQNEVRVIYDSLNRIKYRMSRKSDDNASEWIGTWNHYDDCRRLCNVQSQVVFTLNISSETSFEVTSVDTTNSISHVKTYDLFGAVVDTYTLNADESKKIDISRNYYDEDGVLIGKAKIHTEVTGDDNDKLIYAEKYSFDSYGRKIIVSKVLDDDGYFDESQFVSDVKNVALSTNTGEVTNYSGLMLDYTHDVVGYDGYGRKNLEVSDALLYEDPSPGDRKNVITEFAYNNQNEVIETKYATGKVQNIEFNGQGNIKIAHIGYYDESDTFVAEVKIGYTYNEFGEVDEIYKPHPNGDGRWVKTVHEYDKFNRLEYTHVETVSSSSFPYN